MKLSLLDMERPVSCHPRVDIVLVLGIGILFKGGNGPEVDE